MKDGGLKMSSYPPGEQYENCKDCDGSCICSVSCGPDGYAVCCACRRPGCLLALEEYENPSDACREKRALAAQRIAEFERELEGEGV